MSKVQPKLQIIEVNWENQGTRLSCFGDENKMAEQSGKQFTCFTVKYCLKSWQQHHLKTWTDLYLLNFPIKMHYRCKLNIDWGKQVLACFQTWNYFEWIIKRVLNSTFIGYEELCTSSRVLSLLDLQNSSYPTQPLSIIAKYVVSSWG